MDNLDDSENAKISDSAYSNSCSNSQSRRSHSSKSTHSGSNSSGSSGYGGKPSTSGSSNNLNQQPKKEKEAKKKKSSQAETITPDVVVETEVRPPEPATDFDIPIEETQDVMPTPPPVHTPVEKDPENMEISLSDINSGNDEMPAAITPTSNNAVNAINTCASTSFSPDGFSCVISMHDGVVMYTTSSLTTTLGFPKHMWIGRSFIDFVHQSDRSTFASQITNGLAVPKNVNGTQEKAQCPPTSVSTMVCRIRRYRGLSTGFGVKDKPVTYMPFLLKLTFKNVNDEEGRITYLVIQATPFFSAFKTPYEVLTTVVPFVIRHAANGVIEYVDPESVPYLGHLPQDLTDTDALLLYHPEDLGYLRQVYETIVKEGGLPRSRAYRMITQNGDYIKLQTEWSSFINPWSKKLEFVTGKHHIIEGPANPDVFQPPELNRNVKVSEEEKNKAHMLRENIIRIMNEVLTKPAEIAKQQMSKRCQDLALFMESLMEEQPKTDDELRLEIQDADHSYYERDSVMLGGISPHHDFNDSKSSTETPLSYNQLNYNETLQRYFDSHQPYSFEDYNTVAGENVLETKEETPATNNCFSPMAQNSRDSGEITSSCDSNMLAIGSNSPRNPTGDNQPVRLTESLLSKHNAEMEKELMKMHRETRSSAKGERVKATHETRQKKKEHLARCNASFQPTTAGTPTEHQSHGVKRSSKHTDADNNAHKHHCPSARTHRRRQRAMSTNAAVGQPTPSSAATPTANPWPTAPVNNMHSFIACVGMPPQMSVMSHVPGVPGVFPMYYAPAIPTMPTMSTMPTTSNAGDNSTNNNMQHQFPTAMPCLMYGQPVYGSSFLYSPITTPQISYPIPQATMAQAMQYNNISSTPNPLGLTNRNYEEACKPGITMRPGKLSGSWRDKKRAETQETSSKTINGSGDSGTSAKAMNRGPAKFYRHSFKRSSGYTSYKKRPVFGLRSKSTDTSNSRARPALGKNRLDNSNETVDKTDEESSYSSFYSSFFKTESGSAEDSDNKKTDLNKDKRNKSPMGHSSNYYPSQTKRVARRKMEPPWMEQVCVTSELIYKYQVLTKTLDEVLTSDKKKMSKLEQPSLVNDQLGQLYLDLQLEGVAARLTLEEGITSSSSSGEETPSNVSKAPRKKREYSKLVMIYEEDAPMPPPVTDDDENEPMIEVKAGESKTSTSENNTLAI